MSTHRTMALVRTEAATATMARLRKAKLSYALSGYRGNRRFSVYVPDELAPDIQRALEKGRRVEDLLKEAGVRYVRAQKRERRSHPKK
jgi:molybdopterin-guanine dinucleotide biosynthesis protein A